MMIQKPYEIRLDIRNVSRPRIEYVQGDTNVYPLHITLTDKGVPLDISETTRISLILLTPKSNSVIEGVCETVEGKSGQIVYHVGLNEISEEGTVTAELKLFAQENRLLTSTQFTFNVRKSILTNDAIEASSHFGLFQEIMNKDWTGKEGASAYQIAVENGFAGSLEEWLESLTGLSGPPGPQGLPGLQGSPGIQGPQGEAGIGGGGFEFWESGEVGFVLDSFTYYDIGFEIPNPRSALSKRILNILEMRRALQGALSKMTLRILQLVILACRLLYLQCLATTGRLRYGLDVMGSTCKIKYPLFRVLISA